MHWRGFLSLVIVPLATAWLFAAEPLPPPAQAKILKEVWEAGFLEGTKAGHLRSVFQELPGGDGKIIEASTELELNLIRFDQPLQLKFSMANQETPDGRVLAVVIRQSLSKDQHITRKGKVEGKDLVLRTELGNNPPTEKKIPWSDKALGLYAQERVFQNRKLEPNTKFDFLKFDPTFDTILKTYVEIKDYEEVALLKGERKRLLRTETRIDKIMNIEFPVEIAWIDKDGEAVKRQMEIPGLGQLVTYRTTKEVALAKGGKAPVDIGLSTLVKMSKGIPQPLEAKEVTYRVRLKGVENAKTAFVTDERQEIRNLKEEEFDLVVRGSSAPDPKAKPNQDLPAEYLKSNHFLTSDDDKVKAHAKQAAGTETDPWKKSLKIESWVHQNLKNKNYSEAFATAGEVARKLEGDCTEHSVLAAAMCRAAGVPARTAVGLVYVPDDRAMCFHMWIEVWINGQWYPLDASLGLGRVGPTHVKIADAHWNDTQSFTPLLPVVRVLGKLHMDVVSVKSAGDKQR